MLSKPSFRESLFPLLKSPIVLKLCAAMLLLGLASAIVLPFASLFALDKVRMTPVQFGIFSVAASSSGVLFSVLIGQWTDSHGRRDGWLISSLIAGMVAYGVYAVSGTFSVIFCVAVSLAAMFSAAPAQFLALARARLDTSPSHDINVAMGTIRATFSLAWVLGPPLGALVLTLGGFRGIFVFAIVLLAATAVVVSLSRVTAHQKVVLPDVQLG
ncbi:MFS transporter [Verminephrobacter aporrectodeae subsp. tuberculatae]|nr:MFS transporter [Verminephrobacter aporrectodeae subsp. tuberculatae]